MVRAADVQFIGWGWRLQALGAAVPTAVTPGLLKLIQAEIAAVTHTGDRQETLLLYIFNTVKVKVSYHSMLHSKGNCCTVKRKP